MKNFKNLELEQNNFGNHLKCFLKYTLGVTHFCVWKKLEPNFQTIFIYRYIVILK